LARQPQSFSEFKKQCADLKTALDESDALEKRKRQMLADLRVQFGDDAYVNGLFDELRTMEDLSDKMEPVWRGMIACSRILVSAPSSKQDSYHTICVDPAQQQISLIVPEISTAVQKLQSDIQRFGVSLPPDVLQAIAQ
jgi:ClpP class serine protease